MKLSRKRLYALLGSAFLLVLCVWLCLPTVRRAWWRSRLETRNSYTVCTAIARVVEFDDASAIEKLIALLDRPGHSRARVNCRAAWALGELGRQRAVPPLCEALGNQDPNLKGFRFECSAIRALGKLGGAQAENCIRGFVNHGDEYVMMAVIEALGTIGTASAQDSLAGLLDNSSTQVRNGAAFLLAKRGDNRALPVLLDVAQHDRGLRYDATQLLCDLPATDVWDAAVPIIADNDANAELRGHLLLALARHKQRSAFDLLVQYMKDPSPHVRSLAAAGLRDFSVLKADKKNLAAVPHFIEALADDHDSVRIVAAAALGELTSPKAVEPLISCLRDRNDGVVLASAEALGNIGAPSAVATLCGLLDHENQYVRRRAVQSLEKITGLNKGDPALAETYLKWTTWWRESGHLQYKTETPNKTNP